MEASCFSLVGDERSGGVIRACGKSDPRRQSEREAKHRIAVGGAALHERVSRSFPEAIRAQTAGTSRLRQQAMLVGSSGQCVRGDYRVRSQVRTKSGYRRRPTRARAAPDSASNRNADRDRSCGPAQCRSDRRCRRWGRRTCRTGVRRASVLYCAAVNGISSVPSSSTPIEKSLQRSRRAKWILPHATRASQHGTNWMSSPSRRTRKWADTRSPASPAK